MIPNRSSFFGDEHVNDHPSSVLKSGDCREIPELNGGFSSIPCLITGGYTELSYRVTNTEYQGSEHVWFLEFLNIIFCRI
jgi:hypothetical protein